MKANKILIILVFFTLFTLYGCESNKNEPTKQIVKKEYIPSKDSNNVDRHSILARFEGDPDYSMPRIDSLYRIRKYRKFEDIKFDIYNNNRSLDSTINYYINIFGSPISLNKYENDELNEANVVLDFNFFYNDRYYLSIEILFYDSKINKSFKTIKTTNIRKFIFLPQLISWGPYKLDSTKYGNDYYRSKKEKEMFTKSMSAMDSVYLLIQSRKKK